MTYYGNNSLVIKLPSNANCPSYETPVTNYYCYKEIDLYQMPYVGLNSGPTAVYVSPYQQSNQQRTNGEVTTDCAFARENNLPEIYNNCTSSELIANAVSPTLPPPDSNGNIPTRPICSTSNCNDGCPNGFRKYDNSTCLVLTNDSCLGMNATLRSCPQPDQVCGSDKGGGSFIFGACYKKVPPSCDLPAGTPVCGGTVPPPATTRPSGSGGGGSGGSSGSTSSQWVQGIDNNTLVIGGVGFLVLIILLSKSK